MKLKLSKGCSKYGAQMGRSNVLPDDKDQSIKLHLVYLPFVDGDYDQGGAYWGYTQGTRIYCAHAGLDDVDVRVFVRASAWDRNDAKEKVRELLPNARFYR